MAGLAANLKVTVSVKDDAGRNIDITEDLNGEKTLEEFLQFTKGALISIAEFALKEEQAKGFDKKPVVITDGRVGKSPLDVNPLGSIEFVSTDVATTGVIRTVYDAILTRSKREEGTYIEGNLVFHKGSVIAENMIQLDAWIKSNPKVLPGDTIRFVNVVPYARKLERHGITAQRSKTRSVKSRDKQKRSGERILAANGTYYLSSRVAIREFKGNVKIFFGFILGSTLGVQNLPTITKGGKTLRTNYKPSPKRPKNSGPYLYPYIKLIIGEGTK